MAVGVGASVSSFAPFTLVAVAEGLAVGLLLVVTATSRGDAASPVTANSRALISWPALSDRPASSPVAASRDSAKTPDVALTSAPAPAGDGNAAIV